MSAKVEIVSKEMIKPSFHTADDHLKELKLSFLDQIAPAVYIPLIFFYEANQTHGKNHQSKLLKSSLSVALTHYYPLAGRATESCSIDCNDAGALFIEAKVHAHHLLQVIENPDMDFMKQLLPLDVNNLGIGIDEEEVLLAVQFNLMDCGGTAIAVQMSHKLADGHSLVSFMNTWASICHGNADILHPCFDIASLFPPIDLSNFRFRAKMGITKEKIVTKRLVFDKEKLEILKNLASSSSKSTTSNKSQEIHHPTRVELVSGFIWKHFLEARKCKSGGKKALAALHAVNLRSRMNPSLPDHAFGNIFTHTVALPMIEGENEYHDLIGKLRISLKNVNENFVHSMKNGDEYMKNLDSFIESISKEDIELCNFSSWCSFPMYELDFGFGKPVWVSTAIRPFKNVAILLRSKTGDGIEVWITILEKDASILEVDHIFKQMQVVSG